MRIFVLEDDHTRLQWFRQHLAGHEVTYVSSCTQVEQFQPPYDLICLDHDLGESLADNGLAFIRLIRDRIGDAIVIIHSFSPPGARNMQAEHPAAIIAPFGFRAFKDAIARATRCLVQVIR